MLITSKLFFFNGVARHLAAIRDSPKTLPVSLVVSAIVLILSAMPAVNRRNVFAWDMLLLSGFVTFIVGIALARSGQRRLEMMLDRLLHRGSLSTVKPLADIKNYLEQKARWWQIRVGVVVAVLIFAVFLFRVEMSWGTPRASSLAQLGLFETAWASVAGVYLGRMVANGRVGWHLKSKSASISVSPGHIDGAAGLKPVGDLCFYQAMVVSLAGAFLAVWTFIIPAWPEPALHARYILWMHPYMALLAVALGIEVLAFLVPMWWFHREMRKQKEGLLTKARSFSIPQVAPGSVAYAPKRLAPLMAPYKTASAGIDGTAFSG